MPSQPVTPKADCLGVIPARWGSSRFPGKPLALIGGRPMIEHVWRRARQVIGRVVIATDDARIADCARGFGAEAVLTGECANGTQRCFAAAALLGVDDRPIINIQGDEPFIDPLSIAAVAQASIENPEAVITAARRIAPDENHLIFDSDTVKVVTDSCLRALWFSRAPIPWMRDVDTSEWASRGRHLQHIGLYAFGTKAAGSIRHIAPCEAGLDESLEQLSWIEAGVPIICKIFNEWSLGIDTPDDLSLANSRFI